MFPSRALISTIAIALLCLLPLPVSALAHSTRRPHRGHVAVCKHTRHHRKHKHRRARCARTSNKRATPKTPTTISVLAAASHDEPSASSTPAKTVSKHPEVNLQQLLEAPCQNTQLTPEASNLGLVRESTLCLINQERARHGEQPLQSNSDLEGAAEAHSTEMVSADYFAHEEPSGVTPAERIKSSGYIPSPDDGWSIGENIAWATEYLATPANIVEAWIASPEHLANILESNYQDTGIGVDPQAPPSHADGQPGATYTEDFGVVEES